MSKLNTVARDKAIDMYRSGERCAKNISKAVNVDGCSVARYLRNAGLQTYTHSPKLETKKLGEKSWEICAENMSGFTKTEAKRLRAGESIYVDGHYFRIAGYAELVANGLIKVVTK